MAKQISVGFDISQLAHPGGVSTYTRNLAEELAKIPDLEMNYFYSSLRQQYKGGLKSVKKFKLPPTFFEVLFNRMRNVSIERFLGPVDIFHSSDWVQPPSKALKVTTYHDVIPLKFPLWSHPRIVQVHKKRLELVEKEIDMVIAVSKATKRDLLEVTNIPEEKIVVIYEGVEGSFVKQPEEKIAKLKLKYNLPDEFVLAIGGIGERRNLRRVKEAVNGYNVVITGETVPWVEDDEIPTLYSSAKVLLYPSLYEGFGLPILESMACGTPVITSNISSMPEISGDNALLVDPLKVEDISKKLKMLMEDNQLRKDFIKKGLNHVKKFTWEKTSKQTFQVYMDMIK